METEHHDPTGASDSASVRAVGFALSSFSTGLKLLFVMLLLFLVASGALNIEPQSTTLIIYPVIVSVVIGALFSLFQ